MSGVWLWPTRADCVDPGHSVPTTNKPAARRKSYHGLISIRMVTSRRSKGEGAGRLYSLSAVENFAHPRIPFEPASYPAPFCS